MKKKKDSDPTGLQALRNWAEKLNKALSGWQQVCASPCDQCLFTKNKIVSDERKAEILATCEKEQTHFVCHKGTAAGENVVCNGFFRKHSTPYLELMRATGRIVLVAPELLKNNNMRARLKDNSNKKNRSPRKKR